MHAKTLRFTTSITLSFALVGLALFLARPASAESCNTPPSNASSPSVTEDDVWLQKWCGNSGLRNYLWNSMHLESDLWDGGWGFHDICNVNRFLPRLMNAGYLLRAVQLLAPYTNELHPPVSEPYNATSTWWNFIGVKEDDGFEPRCCNSEPDLNATHFCCDTSTDLCVKWAYRNSVVQRAAILVHEGTHEDVSHIGDNECSNGGSCDEAYGQYNANTMQINFLYDALTAYRTTQVGNQTQHAISIFSNGNSQTCSKVPLLSANERWRALSSAQTQMAKGFRGSTFSAYGSVSHADQVHGASWSCNQCVAADYVFDPSTYWDPQNESCNEKLNDDNLLVNLSNQQACQDYNAGIPQAPSAQDFGQLQLDFLLAKQSCLPPDPADVDAYCAEEKATATNVSELDENGLLAEAGYWEETECLVEFCEESFDPAWSANYNIPNWDDPLGCADALCENDPLCRRMFLRWRGDPDHYVRHDERNVCKQNWVECYDAANVIPPPICNPPGSCGPVASTMDQLVCNMERKQCHDLIMAGQDVINHLNSMLLVDPKLIDRGNLDPWVNPPVFDFQQRMQQLGDDLATGVLSQGEYDTEVEILMGHPESVWASYQQEREAFVSIFGSAGFDQIVGPEILGIQPVDPNSLDVDAVGQAALVLRDQIAAVEYLFESPFLGERIAEFEAAYTEADFQAWATYMNAATALEAALELEAGP